MNRQKPYTLYAMLVLAALWIVFFLCAPYIAPFDPERRVLRTAYKTLVVPIY